MTDRIEIGTKSRFGKRAAFEITKELMEARQNAVKSPLHSSSASIDVLPSVKRKLQK